MIENIPIHEVTGRSEQGATRPFICVSQWITYYVKGADAGLNSLCCERVENRLVKQLLPSA